MLIQEIRSDEYDKVVRQIKKWISHNGELESHLDELCWAIKDGWGYWTIRETGISCAAHVHHPTKELFESLFQAATSEKVLDLGTRKKAIEVFGMLIGRSDDPETKKYVKFVIDQLCETIQPVIKETALKHVQ